MQQEAPHVEFVGVSKRYDEHNLVVKDLSLSVRRGEFLTLLGPSGSGKTTCLMMLAGFESLTEGEIRVNGTSIGDTPPDKRGIGVVFQDYALFPHMTVGKNLAFPLEVRGMEPDERQKRVVRALSWGVLKGLRVAAPPSSLAVNVNAWPSHGRWCSNGAGAHGRTIGRARPAAARRTAI